MTEQQIADGWKRGSIARIIDAMKLYGVTLADLQEADTIQPMVKLLEPNNPALAQRNTVASE